MDLATIIGLILAWTALVTSLILEGGNLASLVNPSAFILVIGGTIGAALIGVPLSRMIGLAGTIKVAFFGKKEDPREIVKQIVEFTRKARREGILVLEEEARKLENRVMKAGVQLIVDGTPEDVVRGILETEILAMQERHRDGAKILESMGGYAPTLGVIGTVMGLVHMLENLNEPDKMGEMIAAAFIATLYGVCTANLLYLPLAEKLKSRSAEEVGVYEMMVEGILAIQAGDNPRIVEAKMAAFCPPKMRADIIGSDGGA
ncbi:MAG TPA: flagellar motor protein [Armatimonadota bacterium]|jgi:chemotaxis protein MotA